TRHRPGLPLPPAPLLSHTLFRGSMSRFILAVRSGHNASAVIGDGEQLLYGVQEERLTGEKNYWGFPRESIRACLDFVAAKPRDLLGVVSGEQQILSRYHSRYEVLRSYSRH